MYNIKVAGNKKKKEISDPNSFFSIFPAGPKKRN